MPGSKKEEGGQQPVSAEAEAWRFGFSGSVELFGQELELGGEYSEGKVESLSGRIEVGKTIGALLGIGGKESKPEPPKAEDPKPGELKSAVDKLMGLFEGLASIKVEELSVYCEPSQPLLRVDLEFRGAGSKVCLVIGKKFGKEGDDAEGFLAGIELVEDEPFKLGGNFLAGLFGDISIKGFGAYFCDGGFPFVRVDRREVSGGDDLLPVAATSRMHFKDGLNLDADIEIGGKALADAIPGIVPPPPKGGDSGKKKGAESSTPDPIHWVEVGKSIGVLSLAKVGVGFRDKRIGLYIAASLSLGPLKLAFDGLGLSYKLEGIPRSFGAFWKNVRPELRGASVSFEQGPLAISGALLKVEGPYFQLDGALRIGFSGLTVSAIGSYADLDGVPSFFVFAILDKALGGPAFCFVTGLALGFGINRRFKVPPIEEVQNFPLLRLAMDPGYLGENPKLGQISASLDRFLGPSKGEYWLAAGVKFLSFGLIETFAILSLSFGAHFEIAILGLSRLCVPGPAGGAKPDNCVARVELAIKAVFSPEQGLLSVEARLTENSYILRREFALRGGFALYAWFSGAHEGDFVVSIGGYHPKFKVPAHYPRPDLVEFRCKLGELSFQGRCYFALCPSAIMAGGGIGIAYESGGIRAWFVAEADFLVQWKPLSYDVSIRVSVGLSLNINFGLFKLHLSLELGASIHLYGPPLGGTARISLYCVSFTVSFGSAIAPPKPMEWVHVEPDLSFELSFFGRFKPDGKPLLDGAGHALVDMLSLSVIEGLLQESGGKGRALVNPHRLAIGCRSSVPVTEAKVDERDIGAWKASEWSRTRKDFGVRPMCAPHKPVSLRSRLELELKIGDASGPTIGADLEKYIDLRLVTKSVPTALWGLGEFDSRKPSDEQTMPDALMGLEIRFAAPPPPEGTRPIDLTILAYDRYLRRAEPSSLRPPEKIKATGGRTISGTLGDAPTARKRSAIIEVLRRDRGALRDPGMEGLANLADCAQSLFYELPEMGLLGQCPPERFIRSGAEDKAG